MHISRPSRTLTVAADSAQWLSIECMNDVWIIGDDPEGLRLYPPAGRPAYRPILRAIASPLPDQCAGPAETLLLELVGEDLLYWTADGTGVWLPGVPGVLRVLNDTGHPPVLIPGESEPYSSISGAVAIHSIPAGPADIYSAIAHRYTLTIWADQSDQPEVG